METRVTTPANDRPVLVQDSAHGPVLVQDSAHGPVLDQDNAHGPVLVQDSAHGPVLVQDNLAVASHPHPEPGLGLADRDRAILDFERQWWKYAGAKEQAVKELFDLSATRYYQVLNALIDRPEALAYDPMLVKRLRRLRSSRQKARTARRLGVDV